MRSFSYYVTVVSRALNKRHKCKFITRNLTIIALDEKKKNSNVVLIKARDADEQTSILPSCFEGFGG